MTSMNLPQSKSQFSPEDYLAWENIQDTRNEYVAGEVFAMVGARDAHNTVTLNLAVLLRNHLRGGPCRVFAVDMKLRVESANCFFYPDVFVTCDERDRTLESDYFKSHAVLVAEVLSDSTAAFDRGRKFGFYRELQSLREYVLIDPDAHNVEIFRRDPTDHWVLYPFGPGSEVELASVGLRTPIGAIYEDVAVSGTGPAANP
jgi:Uma2 family endonuclease